MKNWHSSTLLRFWDTVSYRQLQVAVTQQTKLATFSQFSLSGWYTGHLVTSTLHLYSETSVGWGLGSALISSQLCLSINAFMVSLLAISLIISNMSSATTADVFVHRHRHYWSDQQFSTVGDRAFPLLAGRFWNSFPHIVTSAPILSILLNRLKTYLFSRSFSYYYYYYYRVLRAICCQPVDGSLICFM